MARKRGDLASLPRRQKYDWAAIADGTVWELTRDEDYTGELTAVRTSLRSWATENGYTVATRALGPDALLVQFTKGK